MNEVIRLENVVRMYPGARRAVNDITFGVAEKQRVVINGPPGSGKRTLMKLIAGMEAPSSGSVTTFGKDLHAMDPDTVSRFRNKYIGIVLEDPGFFERLTVLENVEVSLALQGMPQRQRQRAAREQLDLLGIQHIAYAFPEHLSALEAQKASVARALAIQPKLLLLYDILSALSEKETEQFADTMDAIWKYGDFTVLYFTNSAFKMDADRLIRLGHGKIQEDIK